MRATLIAAGTPLGSADLSDVDPRDLRALLSCPPEGSPLARARGVWSVMERLTTGVIYAIQALHWALAGGRGARPTLLDLDSLVPSRAPVPQGGETEEPVRPYGRGRSAAEMSARWGMDTEEGTDG